MRPDQQLMGGHRRTRRPSRMVRLRIIVYVMLVLSAHINISNSVMKEHTPNRHQGQWSKASIAHPEVHTEAGGSHPEVHTKAGGSRPEVRTEARGSRPEVRTEARGSHPEVRTEARGSRPDIRTKAGDSRPEVDSKAGILLPVLVSHLEIHSKMGVSGPKIFEKLLRLDENSNLLEQTRNVLNVKDCPSGCYCVLIHRGDQTALGVLNCASDPFDALPKLFDSHRDITQLVLLNCHLTRLPAEILKLPLLFVNLSMNDFTVLPQVLLDLLPQLLELWMSYNKLSSLPANFTTGPTLKLLALGHNMIAELPQELGGLRHLQTLNLTYNKIKSLPHSVGAWSQLQRLDISHNDLHSLPHSVDAWSQLQALFINHNALHSLPHSVDAWSQLQALDISHNELHSLPHLVGAWSQLQQVDISHNELHSLPHSVAAWSQLTDLSIMHNKLSTLPAEVGNLTQLTGLRLSNNHLKTLPCEIGGMTMLIDLELQVNEITSLPNEITNLKQLQSVDLSNNPLGEVPPLPTEGLMQFVCINCTIQTFRCELLTQGHITNIYLIDNGMKTADCGEIQNFNVLKFDLSHNSLQEVTCEQLIYNMQEFSVAYNNISTLPKACKLLSGVAIEYIGFHHNKVDTLHFSSFCMEQSHGTLQHVGFGYNRISSIDTRGSPLQKCFKPGAVIELQGNMLSTLDFWPMLLSQDKPITVNVSENKLSQFTSSAGSFLHGRQYGSVFIMRGNQIKHFMDVFNGWKVIVNTTGDLNTLLKNVFFDLGYNPLVCDCVDYEVYRYIQTLTTEQYNGLVCDTPLSLKNQNPYHIPLIRFVCDVDVNCPRGCTCAKVPHSQTLNVTCLSYKQTDIPHSVPELPEQNYQYQIDICHQNLHEITFRPYLVKAAEIRLSNNSITAIRINVSNAFQRVKILNLDSNLLQRLPESVAGMSNGTAVEVRLGSNPWVCDCEVMAMKNWLMKNWHIVKDKNMIHCHSPPSMVGVKVIDIKRSMACPKESKTAVYVVVVISCAVFIFLVYVYIGDKLKYAKRQLVGSDECDGEFKEFDIFMCACSADEDAEYVENFLIPELERRDFRVLYHREHFHPGKPIHVNMSEALEKSKRTLAFFSNSFRDSGYSMFEFHSAYDLDIRNNTMRLITIKDTNLNMKKLDVSEVLYFQKYTYLDRDDVKFWMLLENVLPRNRLGAQVRLEGY